MLHEPAAQPDYYPQAVRPEPAEDDDSSRLLTIRALVGEVMDIEQQMPLSPTRLAREDQALLVRMDGELMMSFNGMIRGDISAAYDALDDTLAEHDCFALFREDRGPLHIGPHLIHIVDGRLKTPKPFPWWPNALLFIATVLSVLFTGAIIAIGEIGLRNPELAQSLAGNIVGEMWRGWPYALAIMLILGTHEMAHYFMMRRHNVPGTLPYFIPVPIFSPFGTFGAAILLRGAMRNRRSLFDVGASGPLAGLILALPILIIGLATSPLAPADPMGIVEGNSIVYAFSKLVIFGEALPNDRVDVMVNQFAWAGWTGLFVTALNLIPVGQLDGGHIIYSLLGERSRPLYWIVLGIMLALTLTISSVWIAFIVILFLTGRYYAMPLENITPLDPLRQQIGWATFVIFLLIFTPVPLYQRGFGGGLLLDLSPLMGLIFLNSGLIFAFLRRSS